MQSERLFTIYLETGDWPTLEIDYTSDNLVSIRPVSRPGNARAGKPPGWLEKLLSDLCAFLEGAERSFDYVPLDVSGLSDFQKSVTEEMRRIPFGQTRTYGDLADALRAKGRNASPRAVGRACGRNPFPLVVPCHRVVAENGLGGFGWGIEWKQRLLSLERGNTK